MQQTLEPPRVSTRFHAHTCAEILLLSFPVELLGLLAMRQAPFAQLSCLCIHERNLLEARMIVTPYNQHVRLLSSEPFGCLRFQSLLGPGADIVYGIITLIVRTARCELNRKESEFEC